MRRLAWIAVTVGIAGCGTSDADRFDLRTPGSAEPVVREPAEPEGPTAQEVGVIRGWADALRAGKVAKASGFFALPAFVSNGTPVLTLANRREVREFNRALPCGAKVLDTKRGQGPYVVATFRLTERPGAGRCDGVGNLASTAFVIEEDHIVRWTRVPGPQESQRQPESKPS
jgi:hypothetical protein